MTVIPHLGAREYVQEYLLHLRQSGDVDAPVDHLPRHAGVESAVVPVDLGDGQLGGDGPLARLGHRDLECAGRTDNVTRKSFGGEGAESSRHPSRRHPPLSLNWRRVQGKSRFVCLAVDRILLVMLSCWFIHRRSEIRPKVLVKSNCCAVARSMFGL